MSPTARRLPGALLLLAAIWWAYAPALYGGFLWDDNAYVAYNPLLRDLDGLWRIWFAPTATPQYHPLVFTSYWIEYQLWGDATFGYHVVNVALHAANSVLVWLVLRRLAVPGAAFAAAAFALHPVHVESVAWITERKDVLGAFFYGLAVLAWLRVVDGGGRRALVATWALGAATLLAKTVLCTLPAALLLLAVWRRPDTWRRHLAKLLPLFLLAVVIAWVTVWREHAHGNPPLPYTMVERFLIASRALWTHVGMLAWPDGLTIVYDKWPVSARDPGAWVWPLAGGALLAALAALRPRCGAGPLVAAAFFVVTLAPMLGFVDYNIMRYAYVADHFQYVAGVGVLALAGAAGSRLLAALPAPARVALALLPLAAWALLTRQQAALYVDADTMWRDNVAKNPRSWIGYTYLATEEMRAGRLDAAAEILRTAVAALGEHAEAQRTLAVVEASLGRPQEALFWLQRARRSDPGNARVAQSLGAVLLATDDVDAAAANFAAAVELDPGYAEAWHYRGLAAMRQGRDADARTYLREALRLRPDFPEARADLEALDSPAGAAVD